MKVDHFAWFRRRDGLAVADGAEVHQVRVLPTARAVDGVSHETVMAELRAHGARLEELLRQVRQVCRHSRNEWLLKHTDGLWELVELRRYQGEDLPQVRRLGGLRYQVTPARLPKPVLRYRWGRCPGFVL